MKLYLSSYRLGDQSKQLASLANINRNAVVIANAMDFIHGQARQDCAQREIDDLEALGFQAKEIDLREYFNGSSDLALTLRSAGLVWVRGGNAFILRQAMSKSGFDTWLLDNCGTGLVYGGYSAGIVILGKTLRGLELVDSPTQIPDGYTNNTIWEGLNLIDFSIAPHYKSNHSESKAIDKLVQYYKEHSMKYRVLSDGDVIITR